MKNLIFMDKEMPEDKKAEGIAVYKAFMTGKCNACNYLQQCEKGEDFKFPGDAACMIILNKSKS